MFKDIFKNIKYQSRRDAFKNTSKVLNNFKLKSKVRNINETIGYLIENNINCNYKVK